MKTAALITGGGKRIGRAIALALSDKGYSIALTYNTSKNEAECTKREIEAAGGECRIYKCDLGDINAVDSLLDKVAADTPDISVLINNASVFMRKPLRETDKELLLSTFSVNIFAPYLLTRKFALLFKKGNIVNIIDAKAAKNGFNYSAYVLSKKSLADLTLQSAIELGPDIRVNGISPGLILPPDGQDSAYLDTLAEKIPMKKKGSTDDIVNALYFLLENGYVTGQILYVDGGQHTVTGE